VSRSAPLFCLLLACTGCFYLGSPDPCEDDPVGPGTVLLQGCDPGNTEVVVIDDRWDVIPFHCDISDNAYITWWLQYPRVDDEGHVEDTLRAVAEGVPYLELSGQAIPWEAGVEEGFLKVEASPEPDAPVATHTNYWWLRLLEPVP
jgi:hypothetical protein